METLKIVVLTFHVQFFGFFLFYPSFKDRFDSNCNNLGTDLIENFKNLGTYFIDFIAGRVGTRRYGIRGPIISTEKSMQILVKGTVPPHPTAPEVIRMSYPSYGSSGSTQP